MSKLDPIDNGVRRFRPGVMMALCVFVLIGSAALVFQKVRNKQSDSNLPLSTSKISKEIERIRGDEGPPPIRPSIHPLKGKHRLFLADGCLYRYQELSFTRNFSNQHNHPGLCVWKVQRHLHLERGDKPTSQLHQYDAHWGGYLLVFRYDEKER